MPHAKILTKQALLTLTQLHAELAGKLSANQRETERLRLAIFQENFRVRSHLFI